ATTRASSQPISRPTSTAAPRRAWREVGDTRRMARRLSANSGIKNGHRSGRNRASPLSRLPPRMSYIRVADRDDRARLARRYGGRDECTPSSWPGSVDLSWNFALEARKDESVHGASTEVSFHVV